MNSANRDRVIALAGMFQAVKLVQQTAQGQRRDAAATAVSISSILNTDPETATEVFGDSRALIPGLETVLTQMGDDGKQRDMALTGYVITLMHLERKLARQPDLMEKLTSGIDKIKGEIELLDEDDPGIVAGLAALYKDTVSNLQPRIMVKGDENVLRNTDSKKMIRALLLAGMRAAVLWRQCGGNRIRLIFQRKQLLDSCRELLADARHAVTS
jgi:high frequency lysogenization protein